MRLSTEPSLMACHLWNTELPSFWLIMFRKENFDIMMSEFWQVGTDKRVQLTTYGMGMSSDLFCPVPLKHPKE